ncbi:MAG: hypothetical protein P1U46_02175 [Patescibacteria group bacterium]|nr:hypothetical protein [Patescibacteria group bacterium]
MSVICTLNLSISFSTSKALEVSTKTSTQDFITQNAYSFQLGFLVTSSNVSAFTIPAISSKTCDIISAFLFFAYICNHIVLFGIILLSALIDLISLIKSKISLLSFSISSFLRPSTFDQSESIS